MKLDTPAKVQAKISSLQRDYAMQLDISKANDAGSPMLSYAPRPGSVLITWDNIPDAGYGL